MNMNMLPARHYWPFLFFAAISTLLSGAAISSTFIAQEDDPIDRKEVWKEVVKAQSEGLPKTAIEKLKTIYAAALSQQDLPDAVKAIGTQLMLEGSLENPPAPHMIRRLEESIPETPETIQPILKLLLADWHFAYYQQNRWRFAQRDRTTEVPSDDLETWDLPTILSHIDKLYREALSSAEPLKEIPVADYADILTEGSQPDSYRPTLYDFVAHQAMQFYQLDEQIIRREGAFDLSADSPIFADTQSFLDWKPDTEDDRSYLLHAVQLLQQVTRFHLEDEDPSARLDIELVRLRFAKETSVGSDNEVDVRYRAALQRFADQNVQHPLSSHALAMLAESLQRAGDFVAAHKKATTGENRFPDSLGGRLCHNILEQIEAKELSVTTESTWNAASSQIEIRYRNIDQLHLRLLPFDYANWKEWGNRGEPHNLDHTSRLALFKKDPLKQWKVDLDKRDDYQVDFKSTTGPLEDLAPGCYLLLSSVSPDFAEKNNQLNVTTIWVSRFNIIDRQDNYSANAVYQVLDAISGDPVSGAKVQVHSWVNDGRNSQQRELTSTDTDESGFFKFKSPENYSQLKIYLTKGDQKFGMVDGTRYYNSNRFEDRTSYSTVFFTDRSIYRPGQTIQFKGVLLELSPNSSRYKTAQRKPITIGLWDVNGELVEKRQLTSNEFGSVSGSFTAPADRGTGRMRIGVENSRYGGSTSISVEEYKRPKFQVEVERPEKQFQLDQPVTVTGNAKAYTGAAIDGAKVSWRVVRNVRYPDWWMWRCWYCPPQTGASQEIAHGETTTGVDGNFEVTFDAQPDRSVDRESQPIFTYTVHADVTDTTGETRSSSTSVRLGYTSLQASLNVTDSNWLLADTDLSIQTNVSTLDGTPQAAQGKLTVYRLKQPETVPQAALSGLRSLRDQVFSQWGMYGVTIDPSRLTPDLTDIRQWELGDEVNSQDLEIDAQGKMDSTFQLPVGAYRVKFVTADSSGNPVSTESNFTVIDPSQNQCELKLPNLVRYPTSSVEPGETFRAIWGTGYDSGRAMIQWYHRGKLIQESWTDPGTTQTELTFTPEEKHRGGLQLVITYVRENRSYVTPIRIDVPWSNKNLAVKWEHFVSKLTPGQKETWTAVITDPEGKGTAAEMVATLYDASLDAFSPHYWATRLGSFYSDYQFISYQFSNRAASLDYASTNWLSNYKNAQFTYRTFISDLAFRSTSLRQMRRGRGLAGGGGYLSSPGEVETFSAVESMAADAAPAPAAKASMNLGQLGDRLEEAEAPGQPAPDVNLDQVSARTNLQETAFFFPHLISDKDGTVRIEFEIPEALTEWKFMGLAHDNQLRSGYFSDKAVTSKDLMVQPNPPRFLREGDSLEFSVKVSNQSPTTQTGKVRLQLQDLLTEQSMDSALGNNSPEQVFEIPAGQSKSFYWTLKVPDYTGVLSYKAVGATEKLSDGEEGFLPVLSKRILVTESLPLPIRGPGTKEFEFQSLLDSAQSDSIQNQTLTIQMTSNPSWYAVMALPYLMEYPHECSEQVFNRLYANALAQHIVNSDDRIARVFEQWRGTDALDSPLEKNQDLRNVLIEQSPWLRDAKQESQARRDVGILFDKNRLSTEQKRTFDKLAQMQMSDGAWPWFPGGRANDYITLYVTTGFGRLRQLGVEVDIAPAIKSLDRLDNWIDRTYQELKRDNHLDRNNLNHTICLYLYGRSFFLKDQPVADQYKTAFDYFTKQAQTYWVKLGSRQSQGHLAIALKRIGDRQTPVKILASLTERSKSDEEMGMYWLQPQYSWWWYQAPIETQALMIEAFEEVAGDREKVEDLKVWLLKQKQTQNWKTTKATADAVYALLLRGTSQLASTQLVEVELGDKTIEPEKTEAGTGFYEQRLIRDEIRPELGHVTVTKSDEGVAWGSVHWQYLEDISRIKAYEGTPLTLKKTLYRKQNSQDGPVISPVNGPVRVGDEIVVRVELRTDRDMEYVHLKDYRGSGTEPVNVMSRYKFQDGLYYYESTKDTASHFFIDYLPRGTYVFEYSVRIQHRGTYESGIAELQCMYAPEFNSHSESVTMTVE